MLTLEFKSLHKYKYLEHMLVKFQQNYMVQITWNHELFGKKTQGFLNHFWQSVGAILENISVAETIV